MDLTRDPLVVLNPVLTTMASATAWSSPSSCGRLARIIFVPQNKKCRAASGETVEADKSKANSVSSVAGNLEIGTDSPVSMLSLTIQSPLSNKLSLGN